jgi:hypothetical protein
MKKFLIHLVACLSLISCQTEILQKNECLKENAQGQVILGSKKENPFNKKNYRSAQTQDFIPNYFYLKIRTDNSQKLDELTAKYKELSTVPYDYEIVESGCDFLKNSSEEEKTPWFYFIIPEEEKDFFTQNYEYEIIEEMYVPQYILDEYENSKNQNEENVETDTRFLWFNYSSNKVSGYVKFYDEVFKTYKPAKNIKVRVSQWCYFETLTTDENGYFCSNAKFNTIFQNTVNIKIYFENNLDYVCAAGCPWSASFNYGDKKVSEANSLNIQIKENSNAMYPRILDAAQVYRNYALNDGVTKPSGLKFWANTQFANSVTLMREALLVNTTFIGLYAGAFMANPVALLCSALTGPLISLYSPDIVIGINTSSLSYTQTEQIYNAVFHEMAHASHYYALGSDRIDYWSTEYYTMLNLI